MREKLGCLEHTHPNDTSEMKSLNSLLAYAPDNNTLYPDDTSASCHSRTRRQQLNRLSEHSIAALPCLPDNRFTSALNLARCRQIVPLRENAALDASSAHVHQHGPELLLPSSAITFLLSVQSEKQADVHVPSLPAVEWKIRSEDD